MEMATQEGTELQSWVENTNMTEWTQKIDLSPVYEL
jgi:hypothetical protein